MNTLDKQYQSLLQDILDNGVEKSDRTGTGTISVFGRQIRHKMSEGFPLLTTKKMAWKSMVTELLWFLHGNTNIKYLVDNDCHIWDGDAYEGYKKQCVIHEVEPMPRESFLNAIKNNKFTEPHFIPNHTSYILGDLGPIYGRQWRNWTTYVTKRIEGIPVGYKIEFIDQITNLINDLKNNPDSRRLMVNAWAVHDLPNMVLPPCHYGFQVWTREMLWYSDLDKVKESYISWSLSHGNEAGYMGDLKMDISKSADEIFTDGWHNRKSPFTGKPLIELECFESIPKRAISLMWNQRSVDTFLGLPFNIASYGLLLNIIAREVNMVPDELVGNLGDVHLYSNHIEQAKEQISREPFELPTVEINYYRSDTNSILFDTTKWTSDDFKLVGYQSHPAIKAPLSN